MSTPLKEIYDIFLSKVTDYSFIRLNDEDKLEPVLQGYLESSIVRFTNCEQSLIIESDAIVSDLTFVEKEILATGMLLAYSTSNVHDVKVTKDTLTEVEYKMYSKGNMLSQLLSLKEDVQSELSQLLNAYSLSYGLEEFD